MLLIYSNYVGLMSVKKRVCMKVILLSIDIYEFDLFAQKQNNSETKNFLIYYKHIGNELLNDMCRLSNDW